MKEKERERLGTLRARQKDGTLSYIERIELELLENELEEEGTEEDIMEDLEVEDLHIEDAEIPEVDEGDDDRTGKEVLEGADIEEPPLNDLEEFEFVPIDEVAVEEEMEEKVEEKEAEEKGEEKHIGPLPRPEPPMDADPEKIKMAIALGAGAIMGYIVKDFIEDEDGDKKGKK